MSYLSVSRFIIQVILEIYHGIRFASENRPLIWPSYSVGKGAV